MIFGKAINRYYLKHAPVLLLGILSLLTVDYIQLLIPELYRLVINGVNLGQVVVGGQTLPFTREVLFQHICLPMIWIVVLMVIGRFLWRVCFFGSAVSVAADLRERMFDHSRRLSQQYYQVNKVGNLMSLYTNDLDTIQECFGDGILMFFDAAVLGIMALVKMWRMDCKLTLLALIPAAVMFVLGTVMSQVMTRRWEERQQAFSDLSDFAQENFSGIAVIKAFVKELKELIAFRRLNKENEEVNVAYTKIATLLEVLVTLFVESVICVILGYGGWLVWRGQFNAGQLVEYIGYFEAIVWPIMAISMLIEKTSRGKASLNRITELLDAPIDVADRDGVADLRDPHGGIEFRHLTFRYPDGEYDVLKDVSFTIKPGESVGIVGKTGAGKTALVDLLLRTYNVPDGTLFVDGQDVNAVSIHSVRDACAYVPQDNFLFSDTIAHNIGFGVDDASQADIDRAAALADKLVPYSLLGTAVTYALTRNATRAISILMVDFSCALKLSMPLAVLSAMRECGSYHITVKGGKYLEALANADTIVFDKTGTLTHATPTVVQVVPFGTRTEDEVLQIAACLEEHYPHSMANAVVQAAAAKGIRHDEMHSEVQYVVAHGIASQIGGEKAVIGSQHFVFEDEGCYIPTSECGKFDALPPEYSHLYLAIGGVLAGVICIADPLREEASEVLKQLRGLGIRKAVMMTGDNDRTASVIAKQVGVDHYYAEVLPEDKANFVEQEKAAGHTVIMLGDGINDSPALSAADVGIAISDGAAIAREIADVTIAADSLRELVILKSIANGLQKRTESNYRFIMSFNSTLIVLGAMGILPPATSALLHNASTLGVSLKSMTNLLD